MTGAQVPAGRCAPVTNNELLESSMLTFGIQQLTRDIADDLREDCRGVRDCNCTCTCPGGIDPNGDGEPDCHCSRLDSFLCDPGFTIRKFANAPLEDALSGLAPPEAAELIDAIVYKSYEFILSDGFGAALQRPYISGIGFGWEGNKPKVLLFCAWESGDPRCDTAAKELSTKNPWKLEVTTQKAGAALVLNGNSSGGSCRDRISIGDEAGHRRVKPGTIGCRVVDQDDASKSYVLGCSHAFAATGHGVPHRDRVVPKTKGLGLCPIGTLHDFVPIQFGGELGNQVDAAIVRLDDNYDTFHYKSRTVGGYGPPRSSPAARVCIGEQVMKHGYATDLTYGHVVALHGIFKVQYGPLVALFEDQIVVQPIPGEVFCEGGDSGSLVVSVPASEQTAPFPIGLAFAGTSGQTLVNRVGPVLDQLGVKIDSVPGADERNAPVELIETSEAKQRVEDVAVIQWDFFESKIEHQWDFGFSGAEGFDSNAAPFKSGRDTWASTGSVDLAYRFQREHGDEALDSLEIGFSALKILHNKSQETAPVAFDFHTSYDWDFPTRRDNRLTQLTLGVELDSSWVLSRGTQFENDVGLTGALMATWDKHGKCEMDNTVLFISDVTRHDPTPTRSDAALDRGGKLFSTGIEHTVFSERFDPNLECERAGPFRRILRADSVTFYLGVEFVRYDADGTELGSDTWVIRSGGEQPMFRSRWAVDWYGETARSTFSNPSQELPGVRHEEDSVLLDVGVRWRWLGRDRDPDRSKRLSHLDVRLGWVKEWINSNVDLYDYDRSVITFGIDGRVFSQRRRGAPPITESGGSRSRRRSSQSGTSSAQVPQRQ